MGEGRKSSHVNTCRENPTIEHVFEFVRGEKIGISYARKHLTFMLF